MQYTWQLALVLVPVYFIKHPVSCYIYYLFLYIIIIIDTRRFISHLGMTRPEPGVPRLSHAAAPPDKDVRLGIKTKSSMSVSHFIENGIMKFVRYLQV